MKKQICDRLLKDKHITIEEYAILMDLGEQETFLPTGPNSPFINTENIAYEWVGPKIPDFKITFCRLPKVGHSTTNVELKN